jgi:hypothetical protein
MNILKFKFTLFAVCFVGMLWLLAILFGNVFDNNKLIELPSDSLFILWIAIFLSFFFVAFCLFVDWYLYKLQNKDADDRVELYRATVWAAHHVLNNFLNKLYLIQHNAVQNGAFTEEMSDMMGRMIQEAAAQLLELSKAEPITVENIRKSVAP